MMPLLIVYYSKIFKKSLVERLYSSCFFDVINCKILFFQTISSCDIVKDFKIRRHQSIVLQMQLWTMNETEPHSNQFNED